MPDKPQRSSLTWRNGKSNNGTRSGSHLNALTHHASAPVPSSTAASFIFDIGIDARGPPATSLPLETLADNSSVTPFSQHLGNLSPHSRGKQKRVASESGSNLSFRHIETVPARGTIAQAAWEHSWHSLDPPPYVDGRQPTLACTVNNRTTVESLAKAMCDAFLPSAGADQDEYLPLDKLSGIINETTVNDLFRNRGIDGKRAEKMLSGIFAKWEARPTRQDTRILTYNPERAATRRRRIFAILVLINKVEAIELFIDNGIDDSALPLRIERNNRPGHGLYAESGSDAHDNELNFQRRFASCFSSFTDSELRSFRTHQQSIHVPFFQFASEDARIFFYDLDKNCILPFLEAEKLQLGGYGSVEKVVVHPAHHNYGGIRKCRDERADIAFAVKKLYTPNPKLFKKEVEVFERLAQKRNPESPDHLMHLELAYWHGENGFLVFPCADGNLKEYWKTCRRDPTDKDDIVWFFKQCFGLALGLRRLHDPASYRKQMGLIQRKEMDGSADEIEESDEIVYNAQKSEYGRHGDIKPENILWFKTYDGHENHFVISDFGSTEFNSSVSRSHVPPEKVASAGYTGTYHAPEYRFDEVSQKYDIWSLGCVFLELAVWLFYGKDAALETFPQERVDDDKANGSPMAQDKFYAVLRDGSPQGKCNGVKPSVLKRIESIHQLETCPAAVHDFLDMVQYRMIAPKPADRREGNQIRTELQSIYEHCNLHKEYACCGYSDAPSSAYRTPLSGQALAEKLTKNAATLDAKSPGRHRANSYEIPRITEQMLQSSNHLPNSFAADEQSDDGEILLNSELNTPEKGRHRRRSSQLGQPPLDPSLDFSRPILPRDSTRVTRMSSDSHASMMPITQITTPDIFVFGDSAEFPDVVRRGGDQCSDDECSESVSLEESASYRPGSRTTNTVSNFGRATPENSEVGYPSSEGLEGDEIKTSKKDQITPYQGERPDPVGKSSEHQVQPPLKKKSSPDLGEKTVILSEANAHALTNAYEPRRRKRDSIRAKLHGWLKPFQTIS